MDIKNYKPLISDKIRQLVTRIDTNFESDDYQFGQVLFMLLKDLDIPLEARKTLRHVDDQLIYEALCKQLQYADNDNE